MLAKVLIPFVCGREDGSHDLKAGDVFDVPDRLIDHLKASGYVAPFELPKTVSVERVENVHVRHIGRGRPVKGLR